LLGDNNRQDISCQALTDEFLLSLRDATKREVVKAMGVEGRAIKPDSLCRGVTCSDELHFISNYSKGTHWGAGDINFLFDQNGRVSLIFGSIDCSYLNLYTMKLPHTNNAEAARYIALLIVISVVPMLSACVYPVLSRLLPYHPALRSGRQSYIGSRYMEDDVGSSGPGLDF
jgi:hypothetical protein